MPTFFRPGADMQFVKTEIQATLDREYCSGTQKIVSVLPPYKSGEFKRTALFVLKITCQKRANLNLYILQFDYDKYIQMGQFLGSFCFSDTIKNIYKRPQRQTPGTETEEMLHTHFDQAKETVMSPSNVLNLKCLCKLRHINFFLKKVPSIFFLLKHLLLKKYATFPNF